MKTTEIKNESIACIDGIMDCFRAAVLMDGVEIAARYFSSVSAAELWAASV